MRPRILFLVPADYDALERKGVARMILQRDECGFFERVVTVHPLAFRNRTIDLDPTHRIHEFSLGAALLAEAPSLTALLGVPFRLTAMVVHLVRIVRDERIDVIRANDMYLMGLLAWMVSRITGVPYCVSVHADYEKVFALTPKSGIRRALRAVTAPVASFVMRRAGLVLPISEYLARWVESKGVRRRDIRVIPHGINLALFDSAEAGARVVPAMLDAEPGLQIVSSVARLAKDKYADDVLEVAQRLAARRNDFVMALVGDGPESSRIREIVGADRKLSRRVRLLGFQPYEAVVAIRQASSIALSLLEGFSLIEACAAGCAVVAYDIEWHREIVIDGTTGFLAPEGDVGALVGHVERLLDNPSLAVRMGQAGRALAFERHDERRTSRIKRDAYEWLMAHA